MVADELRKAKAAVLEHGYYGAMTNGARRAIRDQLKGSGYSATVFLWLKGPRETAALIDRAIAAAEQSHV